MNTFIVKMSLNYAWEMMNAKKVIKALFVNNVIIKMVIINLKFPPAKNVQPQS